MFIEEFEEWKEIPLNQKLITGHDQVDFANFFRSAAQQEKYDLQDLAYQIYCLQVCMEGVLETIDESLELVHIEASYHPVAGNKVSNTSKKVSFPGRCIK